MTTETNTTGLSPAEAFAALQAASEYLKAEKDFYAQVNNFLNVHAPELNEKGKEQERQGKYKELIAYMRNPNGKPTWLNELKDASTEITKLETLAASVEAKFNTFKQNKAFAGLNASQLQSKARTSLESDLTISMSDLMVDSLNEMGKIGNQNVAAALLGEAFKNQNHMVQAAYLFGLSVRDDPAVALIDTTRNAYNSATGRLGELLKEIGFNSDDAAKQVSDAAAAAQEAGGGIMGWLQGMFAGLKDKMSNLSIGGVAGAGGVGALFYLITNSLTGNSWFGKILGVMAGVFGMVLGFRAFHSGGDNDQAPASAPAGQSQGNAPSTGMSLTGPKTMNLGCVLGDYPVPQGMSNSADVNGDRKVTCEEQRQFFESIARQIAPKPLAGVQYVPQPSDQPAAPLRQLSDRSPVQIT